MVRDQPEKKKFFDVWGSRKRVLMHLRMLREHQKPLFKKYIFYRLERLKTCFDAFAHTSRPPETFLKKDIFYRLEWLKTCFDAFAHASRQPETFFSKKIFLNVWSV